MFASVFTPVWGSGLLLSLCLFLPLCTVKGCNGTPRSLYPTEWCSGVRSVSGFFEAQLLTWAYLFGFMTAAGTLAVLATGKARHFRALWLVYAVAIAIEVFGMWVVEGRQFRERGKELGLDGWITEVWVLGPTIALLGVLVLTYLNCRTWFAAALWVQMALSALSAAWFIFLALLLRGELLLGGAVSIAASVLLFLSSACARLRGLEALDPGAHRAG